MDPLSIPKPEKKEVQFTQEQAHNILAPYYRTIDEPWDHQTASDPRITLAAMFKANSNKFRQDPVARQCAAQAASTQSIATMNVNGSSGRVEVYTITPNVYRP